MDPGKKKFERLIFPTKYVIPKSLKVSHWPSKCINLKHPYIIYNYLSFWSRLFVSNTTIQWVDVCHDIVAHIRWTHPRMIPGCYVCFTQGTWPSFPKNNGGPSWLYKLLTYPHLQSTYSNILLVVFGDDDLIFRGQHHLSTAPFFWEHRKWPHRLRVRGAGPVTVPAAAPWSLKTCCPLKGLQSSCKNPTTDLLQHPDIQQQYRKVLLFSQKKTHVFVQP